MKSTLGLVGNRLRFGYPIPPVPAIGLRLSEPRRCPANRQDRRQLATGGSPLTAGGRGSGFFRIGLTCYLYREDAHFGGGKCLLSRGDDIVGVIRSRILLIDSHFDDERHLNRLGQFNPSIKRPPHRDCSKSAGKRHGFRRAVATCSMVPQRRPEPRSQSGVMTTILSHWDHRAYSSAPERLARCPCLRQRAFSMGIPMIGQPISTEISMTKQPLGETIPLRGIVTRFGRFCGTKVVANR